MNENPFNNFWPKPFEQHDPRLYITLSVISDENKCAFRPQCPKFYKIVKLSPCHRFIIPPEHACTGVQASRKHSGGTVHIALRNHLSKSVEGTVHQDIFINMRPSAKEREVSRSPGHPFASHSKIQFLKYLQCSRVYCMPGIRSVNPSWKASSTAEKCIVNVAQNFSVACSLLLLPA